MRSGATLFTTTSDVFRPAGHAGSPSWLPSPGFPWCSTRHAFRSSARVRWSPSWVSVIIVSRLPILTGTVLHQLPTPISVFVDITKAVYFAICSLSLLFVADRPNEVPTPRTSAVSWFSIFRSGEICASALSQEIFGVENTIAIRDKVCT